MKDSDLECVYYLGGAVTHNRIAMPSLPQTRASLILRLPNAADAQAWDDFVAIYGPLVYRLARRHGMQPADGDDLVQEVLAAVARSVEGWLARPDRGPFCAWLLRIAKNHAMNALTRRKHRPIGTGDSDTARLIKQQPAAYRDADSQFDLEYRRELFRWAADRIREEIADRTWQAFSLSTIQQQPIAAVAKQLEMTVGSVYIARSRVMARLKQLVKQFEEQQS